MSLDRMPDWWFPQLTSPAVWVCNESLMNVKSLLWLYPLNFDFERDIHDESLKEVLWLRNLFIRNFDRNWYSSIWKYISYNNWQVEMWTWYALVSEQYLRERWDMQWICITAQSDPVWRTTYKDEQWNTITTAIYFVWPATKESDWSSAAIAYSKADIEYWLHEILWLNKKEDNKRKIILWG